jgi:hypothetical protein
VAPKPGSQHVAAVSYGDKWMTEGSVDGGRVLYCLRELTSCESPEWDLVSGPWPTYGSEQKSHGNPRITPCGRWVLPLGGGTRRRKRISYSSSTYGISARPSGCPRTPTKRVSSILYENEQLSLRTIQFDKISMYDQKAEPASLGIPFPQRVMNDDSASVEIDTGVLRVTLNDTDVFSGFPLVDAAGNRFTTSDIARIALRFPDRHRVSREAACVISESAALIKGSYPIGFPRDPPGAKSVAHDRVQHRVRFT